jgi:hypothetical protein
MSHDLEFQKFAFTNIAAQFLTDSITATLTAHPQVDEAYPYVELGEVDIDDHNLGQELRADFHVWSNDSGPEQVKTILHSIRAALHEVDGNSGGFCFTGCRQTFTTVFMDRDDGLWHGVATYRALAS